MKVRAGWLVQHRLHGVPPGGQGYNISTGPKPGLRVNVEFLMKRPTFPAKVIEGTRVLDSTAMGPISVVDRPVTSDKDGFHIAFTWITVMVTDDVDDTTDGNNQQEQLISVIPKIKHFRDHAFFIAGVFAVIFRNAQFELWTEQPVVFYGTDSIYTKVESTVLSMVQPVNVKVEDLSEFIKDFSQVVFAISGGKSIIASGKWLVMARQLFEQPTEQFFAYYRVLESLAYGWTRDESRLRRTEFDSRMLEIESLLRCSSNELKEFVGTIKRSFGDLPISDKFSQMADTLFSPDQANLHKAQFGAIKKIRNDLVHGTRSQIPKLFREVDVSATVDTLAHEYFLAVSRYALKKDLSLPIDSARPKTTVAVCYFGLKGAR